MDEQGLNEVQLKLDSGSYPEFICPFHVATELCKHMKKGLCYNETNVLSESKKEDICSRCWKMFLKMKIE
jgi:hypothetical protein